jgi:hypothetical protein
MRPKHNRHPYKGTKFRKRYPTTNFSLYVGWLKKYFLPKYLTKDSDPFRDLSRKTWTYKDIRKLYNAHYKALRREHKKNGGFCIGDQFWNIIK